MGFVKDFTGDVAGTPEDWGSEPHWAPAFGDQVVLCQAHYGGGGGDDDGPRLLTDGDRILVPAGTALVTMEGTAITGFITDGGGYTFHSDPSHAQLVHTASLLSEALKRTWDAWGRPPSPGVSQRAFFVNLGELPNRELPGPLVGHWDGGELGPMAAEVQGHYTPLVSDPMALLHSLMSRSPGKDAVGGTRWEETLFLAMDTEAAAGLDVALAHQARDVPNLSSPRRGNGFALGQCLGEAMDDLHQWDRRGFRVLRFTITSLVLDDPSRSALEEHRARKQRLAEESAIPESPVAPGSPGEPLGDPVPTQAVQGPENGPGGLLAALDDPLLEQRLAKVVALHGAGLIGDQELASVRRALLGL